MFHQRRRVAGGRDPAFGGEERGFVCFSLHARALFVACWCASFSAVSLTIIESDNSAAVFSREGKKLKDICESRRKDPGVVL